MQLNGRDRALKVTADGKGLAGHAGAVPLRKAVGQAGLTSGLSAALVKKTTSPLLEVVVRTEHQPDRIQQRGFRTVASTDQPDQAPVDRPLGRLDATEVCDP